MVVLFACVGTLRAGSLETGSLQGGSLTGNSGTTFRVHGRIVQVLTEGLIVYGVLPRAKRVNGQSVYGDLYVKHAVAGGTRIDVMAHEAGTFSYKDLNGNAKTVRAYTAK